MKRVLFAAGGTMGHLGPAIAVATALKVADPQSTIAFVGTRSGIESQVNLEFPRHQIAKAPLPRGIRPSLLFFPIRFLLAFIQSLPLVIRTDVVVGFGGYVATPLYLAARLARRRIILHEANALPGFANRVGRVLGAECFANFDAIGKAWNCRVIGMPLSEGIIDYAHRLQRESQNDSGRSDDGKNLLIIGGSQGSMRINEAVWGAIDTINPEVRIVHAVGRGNLEKVPSRVRREGYQAVAFIEDMASAYESANLVIARAGAVTCAELIALGKRAILVPLGHGNGEQAINAQTLVDSGIALAVPDDQFDGRWLSENLSAAWKLKSVLPTRAHLNATTVLVNAILQSRSGGE